MARLLVARSAEKPACKLRRVRADLSNREVRRSLLGELAGESTKALVITEGLLIYLRAQEVSAFAEDLKSFPAFKRWVLDIVSPGLLRMQKNTHQQFGAEVPALPFAPENGPIFLPSTDGNRLKCTPCLTRLLG